jgi:hypothetical protein
MIKLALCLCLFSVSTAAAADHMVDDRYLNARLDTIFERLNAMDNALKLKSEEYNRRLEGLNELRDEVVTDRKQFLRHETFDSKIEAIDLILARIDKEVTRLAARFESRVTRSELLSVAAILSSLALLVKVFVSSRVNKVSKGGDAA